VDATCGVYLHRPTALNLFVEGAGELAEIFVSTYCASQLMTCRERSGRPSAP
jgi:hypothetical protein